MGHDAVALGAESVDNITMMLSPSGVGLHLATGPIRFATPGAASTPGVWLPGSSVRRGRNDLTYQVLQGAMVIDADCEIFPLAVDRTSAISGRHMAAATDLPAVRPLKRQPPRNVPSSEL